MVLRRRAVVVEQPPPSTAGLILDEARRVETLWHQLHASMDQRAGVLLGFSGVLVAMSFTTDVTGRLPAWSSTLALLLVCGAALCAASPLLSRSMQTLSPGDLAEDYSTAPHAAVVDVVTSQVAWIVDEAQRRLRWKTWAVRVAALLLAASVLTVTAGSIVTSNDVTDGAPSGPTRTGGGAA